MKERFSVEKNLKVGTHTRRANGMTQCDGTAIYVDFLGIQSELLHAHDRLRRESLVQLVQVHFLLRPVRFLQLK